MLKKVFSENILELSELFNTGIFFNEIIDNV